MEQFPEISEPAAYHEPDFVKSGANFMMLEVALSTLLILSAACYLALGLRLVAGKREIGKASIGVMFMIVSLWVLGGAIEMLSTSFFVFSIGRAGHFIGTAFLPIAAYSCRVDPHSNRNGSACRDQCASRIHVVFADRQ